MLQSQYLSALHVSLEPDCTYVPNVIEPSGYWVHSWLHLQPLPAQQITGLESNWHTGAAIRNKRNWRRNYAQSMETPTVGWH